MVEEEWVLHSHLVAVVDLVKAVDLADNLDLVANNNQE